MFARVICRSALVNDQRGFTAVIMALVVAVLMGFCGLAVDVGMWEVSLRNMQGAADQAALAAATAYRNAGETIPMGDASTAADAAYATAMQAGYAANVISVEAYNNGSSCTNDGCVQVTITRTLRRYFTGIFSSAPVVVSVNSVGTCNGCGNGSVSVTSNGGTPCVMALDASGKGVITDTGGAIMSLQECNLYNNAPTTDATIINNNGAIEGCTVTNSCGSKAFLAQPNNPGGIDVPVITGAAPAPDPYAGMKAPTLGLSCIATLPANPVPSGTYCPGTINNANVTFATGSVIVLKTNGSGTGLSTKGNATLSCGGCTLYVLGGGSINANSTMNLSSPTSGPYSGVAVWFGDASAVSWAGGNGAGFSGAIYAPASNVSYAGNQASTSTCTRLIAASIALSGGSTASFNNSGCPAVAGPVLASSGVSGTTAYTGSPVLSQ